MTQPTKRSKRRTRGRLRPILHALDKSIKLTYNQFHSSYGGTRCPGCGINIRPHYLINQPTYAHGQARDGSPVFLDMTPVACDKMGKKCPGERDWG